MRHYTVFDSAGSPIRYGWCADQDFEMQQFSPSETLIEGEYEACWFDGTSPVPYTEDQLAARKAWPAYPAAWSNASMSWVDGRSVTDRKQERWSAIKAERSLRENLPFESGGLMFDADATRLPGAVLDAVMSKMSGTPWLQPWVLADNTTTMLDADQMIAAGQAMKAAITGLWVTSQELRAQIETATTAEEVDAVAWPEGPAG